MTINEIIQESGMTKYRIAKISGVPHTTLYDLCNGKSRIEKWLCRDSVPSGESVESSNGSSDRKCCEYAD